MIEPKLVGLQDFPKSESKAEGMIKINADYSNLFVKVHGNIEYTRRNDIPLHLHILVPTKQSMTLDKDKTKYPLIVYVQGSAWKKQNTSEHIAQLSDIAKEGYIIGIVEYRDSSIAPFPVQIEDTKTAMNYLIHHKEDYQINDKQIFLWGDSSGAHTAMMSGLSAKLHIFEKEILECSDNIKGIIDYYGPTLVSKMQDEPSTMNHISPTSPEGLFLGGVNVLEHKEEAYKASPLAYIHDDIPPILIIHGNKDRLVPFDQSVLLYNQLKEKHKEVKLYYVDGADHGGPAFWNHETYQITLDFIKQHLK